MISMSSESFSNNCTKLAEMYNDDLPCSESFDSECEMWKVKWEECSKIYGVSSLPDSPKDAIPQTTSMFPNIRTLLIILATLPVTTCTAEQSSWFSSLKRTKTLTNLTILHVFKDIDVNVQSAIDEFARRHPRRLQLANLLSD